MTGFALGGPLSAFRRISLRAWPVAGGFLDEGTHSPEELFTGADDIILLVHGYAVNEFDACKSYDHFAANLDPPWRRMTVAVHWPGDSASNGRGYLQPSRFKTLQAKASYMAQPERARLAAKKLANVIKAGIRSRRQLRKRAHLKLHIVGHSMGCRLTLELLDQIEFALGTGSAVEVPLAALMAPAVPGFMVEAHGVLQSALTVAERLSVHHSPDDGVLTWLFKPGQIFETPISSGFGNREAIGRRGAPAHAKITNFPTTLGHGQYWQSPEVAGDLNKVMADIHPKLARPGMALRRHNRARSVAPRLRKGRKVEAR